MALDPEIRRLFDEPNFGHVSTLMPDGSPQATPVWVGTLDDYVAFYKEASSIALRNLRRDPRIAISIVASDNPYRCGYLRGRAVEFREGDEAERWLDQRAARYTGKPYPPARLAEVTPGAIVLVQVERASHYTIDFMSHTPVEGAP